jgi:hypothetical protein
VGSLKLISLAAKIVRAPSGDDAALIAEVLGPEGCEVVPLDDLPAARPRVGEGAWNAPDRVV